MKICRGKYCLVCRESPPPPQQPFMGSAGVLMQHFARTGPLTERLESPPPLGPSSSPDVLRFWILITALLPSFRVSGHLSFSSFGC